MEERKKLFSHVTSEEAAKIREEMKKPTRLFSPKDKEEQKNNLISVTNTSKICQNVEINQIQKENTVCNKQEALLAQASIFAQARNPIAETTSVEPSCQMPCNTVTGYSQGIGEKQKKDAFNYDAVSFAYANGYLYALDDREII